MRLSIDRIKAALLDPDSEVRTAAAYYCAAERSSDPSPMHLVIQAFEQYGNDAFEGTTFLENLAQTDESVAWLCRQIDQIDPDPDGITCDLFNELVDALRHADAALLERHAATIRQVRQLDEDSKTVISNRIQLAYLPAQVLWHRLIDFCHEQDQKEEISDIDLEFGSSLVDALAKYPGQFADKALEVLERNQGEDTLEEMVVRLAGLMRLEGAIPMLIDLLADVDTFAGYDARWSLIRIGTDSVVKKLSLRYAADEDVRGEIASLLGDFHSDFSVQTCLEFLREAEEQDGELRECLILSLLANFTSEAIEPARQFILTHEKTPEVLEVREGLLLACKMLDARFPEFDAWLEDSTHDVEFRRAWYEENGYTDSFDDLEADDEDEAWDAEDVDDDLENDFDDQPPERIVRHDEKVGRNDPCPCGSGKKYKKCCLHKQVPG